MQKVLHQTFLYPVLPLEEWELPVYWFVSSFSHAEKKKKANKQIHIKVIRSGFIVFNFLVDNMIRSFIFFIQNIITSTNRTVTIKGVDILSTHQ